MQLCYAKTYSPSSIKIGCPSKLKYLYVYGNNDWINPLGLCDITTHKQKKAMGNASEQTNKKEKAKQQQIDKKICHTKGGYAKN